MWLLFGQLLGNFCLIFIASSGHTAPLPKHVSIEACFKNDRCGRKLKANGPWQWFSGIIFASNSYTCKGASSNPSSFGGNVKSKNKKVAQTFKNNLKMSFKKTHW